MGRVSTDGEGAGMYMRIYVSMNGMHRHADAAQQRVHTLIKGPWRNNTSEHTPSKISSLD